MKKLLCMVLITALAGISVAADKYVDLNATGANNGTSWADAWTSMDTAMTNAAANDTIIVAEGTYVPSVAAGWTPTNSPLTIVAKTGDEVILSGDTNGDDTFADLLDDPCALDNAVLSGDHSDNVRIFNLASKNLTLDGFTITGGTTHGTDEGGFINMSGTSVVNINNCLVTQCHSMDSCGCIRHNCSDTLTITNCRFIQNSSHKGGTVVGGGSGTAGSIIMSNCLLQINMNIAYSGTVYPGRISAYNSITDCIFDRCQMCNNTDGSSGIMTRYTTDATLNVSNCVFNECMSIHHGAAVYARAYDVGVDVTANVSNCLVTGCTNWQPTGSNIALHAEAAKASSTVLLNLTNCTVADNHPNGQGAVGGWVYGNDPTAGATVNLKNCIVWGNAGGGGNAQLLNDTNEPGSPRLTINADYCCWDNSDPNDWGNAQSLGTGNLLKTADASLDPGFEKGLLSAYALSSSSPCIDTGDPTSDYSAEPKCNGGRINMGIYGGTAYATPTASSTKLADLDCDNDVDLADFSVMSSQWLQ